MIGPKHHHPAMPSEVQNDLVTLSLTQSSHLLLSFTHFLTVAIHNVLFYRSLYPPTTFLTTRAYNLAVHQSRHPAVCNWIRDAVDAVRAQLVLGSVSRVAIVIHAPDARVLERWMIDVAQFPAFKGYREPRGNRRDEEDDGVGAPERISVPGEDRGRGGADVGGGAGAAQQQRDARVNWTDVDEAFRGAVRRMALAGEKMAALPEGCSFTVAVELRDESEAPIGVCALVYLFRHGMQTDANKKISIRSLGSRPSPIFRPRPRTSQCLVKMLEGQEQGLSDQLKSDHCFLSAGSRKGRQRTISPLQIHHLNRSQSHTRGKGEEKTVLTSDARNVKDDSTLPW